MMRKNAPIIVVVAIVTLPIAVMAVQGVVGISSQPSWQFSARNSLQGVIVDVYKSNETLPTYTTVLEGQTINTEVERVLRVDLPIEIGETTFYDETLRPGRWTVVINDTEIDIMERALIVDRTTEILPQE